MEKGLGIGWVAPQTTLFGEGGESVFSLAMEGAAALTRKGVDGVGKLGKRIGGRFVKGESLSLTAWRLLALMIRTAGGEAWRDTRHRLRKSEIRRGHKSNDRIADMLEELHRTLLDRKSTRLNSSH